MASCNLILPPHITPFWQFHEFTSTPINTEVRASCMLVYDDPCVYLYQIFILRYRWLFCRKTVWEFNLGVEPLYDCSYLDMNHNSKWSSRVIKVWMFMASLFFTARVNKRKQPWRWPCSLEKVSRSIEPTVRSELCLRKIDFISNIVWVYCTLHS